MVNKSKSQGTRNERETRVGLHEALGIPIVRFAEEGIYDRGDLGFRIGDFEFVVECRDRETMQVHTALGKARRKAGAAAITLLQWKRKRKLPGSDVRRQVGPEVAIVAWSDMVTILQALQGKGGHERREI